MTFLSRVVTPAGVCRRARVAPALRPLQVGPRDPVLSGRRDGRLPRRQLGPLGRQQLVDAQDHAVVLVLRGRGDGLPLRARACRRPARPPPGRPTGGRSADRTSASTSTRAAACRPRATRGLGLGPGDLPLVLVEDRHVQADRRADHDLLVRLPLQVHAEADLRQHAGLGQRHGLVGHAPPPRRPRPRPAAGQRGRDVAAASAGGTAGSASAAVHRVAAGRSGPAAGSPPRGRWPARPGPAAGRPAPAPARPAGWRGPDR